MIKSPSREIMNEPEGSVLVAYDDEPCYDTSNLGGTGAGWAGTGLAMRDILRFTNQLSAAIKAADPKALVTTGAWSEWTITNQVDGARDYYRVVHLFLDLSRDSELSVQICVIKLELAAVQT